MIMSSVTLLVVLALLGRKEFNYAKKADLNEVFHRLGLLGRQQSKLFRYLEAVDDRTGGRGHQVLGRHVPGDNT